jgi:hypothetical protein
MIEIAEPACPVCKEQDTDSEAMAFRSERRLRRRNPCFRGEAVRERAARLAANVGRGAKPPSDSNPLPVSPAVQAHDAAVARRFEVARGDENLLALEPLHQRAPRFAREIRIHVRA